MVFMAVMRIRQVRVVMYRFLVRVQVAVLGAGPRLVRVSVVSICMSMAVLVSDLQVRMTVPVFF